VSVNAFCGAWWGQQWQRCIKGHARSLARVPMRRVEDLRRLCPPPCHALDHLYFLRPSVLLGLVQLPFLVLFRVVLCRMRSSRPFLHVAAPPYPLCPPLVLGPCLLLNHPRCLVLSCSVLLLSPFCCLVLHLSAVFTPAPLSICISFGSSCLWGWCNYHFWCFSGGGCCGCGVLGPLCMLLSTPALYAPRSFSCLLPITHADPTSSFFWFF